MERILKRILRCFFLSNAGFYGEQLVESMPSEKTSIGNSNVRFLFINFAEPYYE
jgi:hypothetical protein